MDLTLIAVVVALIAGLAGAWMLMGSKGGGGGGVDDQQAASEVSAKAQAGAEQDNAKGGKKGKPGKGGGPPPKKEKKADTKALHKQMICSLKGHSSDILSFRFSGSCKVAASVAEDRKLIVWDFKSLPPSQLMNMAIELDHGVGCALSPDDRFVAVATSRSKEIKVFKVKGAKEGAQVSFATGHSRPITSLDWSYDGKFLVTFCDEPKDAVRVFRPSGECIGVINPGALEVYSCSVSPDSRFVSVASMQCDSKLWEVANGKEGFKVTPKSVMELTGRSGGGGATGHSAAVHSVDFGGCSPNVLSTETKDAATASKDGTCKVWNVDVRYKFNEDPKCRLTIPSPDSKPLRLVSLSKGKTTEYVATFSDTAGLCFYTVPDGGLVSQIAGGHCGHIQHMSFAPGPVGGHDHVLTAVCSDGKVRLWVPRP